MAGEPPAGNWRPRGTSDIVAVQASSALSARIYSNCVAFDRLSVPPTVAAFSIPKGKVFVVTSIDWTGYSASLSSKSMLAYFFTVVGESVNGPSATGVALADSAGVAGGNVLIPSGIVIKANQQLCVGLQTLGSNDLAPADAVAHGYVIPDWE